jgi:hypothetical protein
MQPELGRRVAGRYGEEQVVDRHFHQPGSAHVLSFVKTVFFFRKRSLNSFDSRKVRI